MNPTYDKKSAKRRRLADIEEELMLQRYPHECRSLGSHQITNKEKEQFKVLCHNSVYLEKEMMKRKMCKSNLKINLNGYDIIKVCFPCESSLQEVSQSKKKFCNLVKSLPWEVYLDSPILDQPICSKHIYNIEQVDNNTVLNMFYPKEHEEIILTLFSQWKYKEDIEWEERIINGERR